MDNEHEQDTTPQQVEDATATTDQETPANTPRTRLRTDLRRRFERAGLQLLDKILERAIKGDVRPSEVIKILDMMLKYSIGTVQQTELSGETSGPKIILGFSQGLDPHQYLAQLQERQNIIQLPTSDDGQSYDILSESSGPEEGQAHKENEI